METRDFTVTQIKRTKRIEMDHIQETGDVLIRVDNDRYIIVPNNNVWSVIRGLISDRQRFYRKKIK